MYFKPKSLEEIEVEKQKKLGVLPEGSYSFEVHKAEETISRKGKEAGLTEPNQIVLHLKIVTMDDNDREIVRIVRDYVGIEAYDRLWNVCEHLGLLEQYKKGCVAPDDFVGRVGKAKIVVREDKTGKWPPSNWVDHYINTRMLASPPTPDMVAAEGFSAGTGLDDEIPF